MDPKKVDTGEKATLAAMALAAAGKYYANHRKEINKAVVDFFKRMAKGK